MALEKSVLTEAAVTSLLEMHYGIHAVSVTKIEPSSANCYHVSDTNRHYFLKEFQSGFSPNDLLREAKLVNFLYERDIPTARFISTRVCSHYPRCADFEQIFWRTRREEGEYPAYLTDEQRCYTKNMPKDARRALVRTRSNSAKHLLFTESA